jgi:hypothetical protein
MAGVRCGRRRATSSLSCVPHEPAGLRRPGRARRSRPVPRRMATPPEARAVLFPLYAFNLEVSRAPWVTEEPMIAEMRLQFWRDVAEEIGQGAPPRAHEVAAPLAEAVRAEDAGAARRAGGGAALGHLPGRLRGCGPFRALSRRDGRQSRLGGGPRARRAGGGGDGGARRGLGGGAGAVPGGGAGTGGAGAHPAGRRAGGGGLGAGGGGAAAPFARAQGAGHRSGRGGICALCRVAGGGGVAAGGGRSGSRGGGRLGMGAVAASWRLARLALGGRW